jgi:hypothetical protein
VQRVQPLQPCNRCRAALDDDGRRVPLIFLILQLTSSARPQFAGFFSSTPSEKEQY